MSVNEWSGIIWHLQKMPEGPPKKAQTREGNFPNWQVARLWVLDKLKHEKNVIYAEVCHVEMKPGSVPRKREDVAVIKFMPQHGTYIEQRRKEPWFR